MRASERVGQGPGYQVIGQNIQGENIQIYSFFQKLVSNYLCDLLIAIISQLLSIMTVMGIVKLRYHSVLTSSFTVGFDKLPSSSKLNEYLNGNKSQTDN
jgi:hypothetical protein